MNGKGANLTSLRNIDVCVEAQVFHVVFRFNSFLILTEFGKCQAQ